MGRTPTLGVIELEEHKRKMEAQMISHLHDEKYERTRNTLRNVREMN